ncbi:hypothetical protein, partial [Bacillus sp. MYb209]|uniref:hypothetical protein n=1 Tax=Bacillus sp. MYb209 TaxID=1848605 RepID=UPI001C613700
HSEKFETRQGLFDVPTFITSIKDNKKLRGKTAFCIKIYVKLMDVRYSHMHKNINGILHGCIWIEYRI